MCVQERRAWYSLTVVLVTFALYGIFVAVPKLRPGATAAFALLAFVAVEGLVGRKTRDGSRVLVDERDLQIAGFSSAAGFGVLWVLFVAAVMIPFFIYGPDKELRITTSTLSNTIFPAMGVFFFVRSLAMILLYRKQANG